MDDRNFFQLLEARWTSGYFVCVGLDSKFSQIPESAHRRGNKGKISIFKTMVAFNRAIVEKTKDLVAAYKPNIAFYEAYGVDGIRALQRTISDIQVIAPKIPVILDAKRADIGNTNLGYVQAAFEFLKADAVTVNPYFGVEALEPFLSQRNKGIVVLCRTSNPGAGEFQDLPVPNPRAGSDISEAGEDIGAIPAPETIPSYQRVAYDVSRQWNKNGNCVLVVGATCPDELREVRGIAGDIPILIPGIGAQGGCVADVVAAGKDSRGMGMIINSSRGIIFASKEKDFAKAARRETLKLHNLINLFL
jgi:orotidine-5'-phosphate decarboxylase